MSLIVDVAGELIHSPRMLILLALAAAGASPHHIIDKVFDVSLGKPPGDLGKLGFRSNEYGVGSSWVRTDVDFFDRVTVDEALSLQVVEAITASKRYESVNHEQQESNCKADLDSIAATIRAKYPALRKAAWLKSEDGMGGMLGYYYKKVFEEPPDRNIDPSPARTVSLACIGSSALSKAGEAERPTMLLLSYRISEKERGPIERAFRAQEQQRERARARAIGVDPGKL